MSYAGLIYYFPRADRIPTDLSPRFRAGYWGRMRPPVSGYGHCERMADREDYPSLPVAETGMLVACGDHGCDPSGACDVRDREWEEVDDGVWIGIHKDAEPGQYLRELILRPLAYFLNTPRGKWTIPVAVLDSERCAIPRQDRIRRGDWVRVPSPDYVDLTEAAIRWMRVEAGDEDDPGRDWRRNVTVSAIQANYALTPAELAVFGVLNDDTYSVVLDILTDAEERKKKHRPSSSTSFVACRATTSLCGDHV